jgi:hypothetical protein
MIRDDRGVSTQISQVFGIAMTGILIVLLVNGAATYVQNQRTAAVETQLETVGNRLAEQLERADELGQRGGNVTVRTTVQDTLSGTGYRAVLESGSPCRTDNFRTDSCLVLDAYGADAQRAIPLNVTADLRLEHGSGGRYVIHAEGDRTGLASSGSASARRSPSAATRRSGARPTEPRSPGSASRRTGLEAATRYSSRRTRRSTSTATS